MSLKSDLELSSVQAGVLETANAALTQTVLEQQASIDAQAGQIANLTAQLEECQGDPGPGPQPDDGHYVALSDDVNRAIRSLPAGSTFALEPGDRTLTEPLERKTGNRLWSDGAMFVGPGAGGIPFLPVDVSGLILQGIGARYFGPATTDQGSGMIDHMGGDNLLIEDGDFGYSNRSIISGHGTWNLTRSHFHHGGKFSGQGSMGVIEECEFSYSGRSDIPGVVGWTASRDRGGCKWVKSKGMRIISSTPGVPGLWTHDHDGTGLWWDIQNEDWYAEEVLSEDNARHGISMEVSYGSGELVNPTVRRCGTSKGSGETSVPVPAGILVSLTPDVRVTNATVEDCWNGLIVRQWAHPQSLPPGDPNRIGNTDRTRLGCENIIFQGGVVKNSKQFDAGLHGPYQNGLRPTRNVHWNGTTFDSNASYCSSLHIN